MNNTLKPCPNCGSDHITLDFGDHLTSNYLQCFDCSHALKPPPNTPVDVVIDLWNRTTYEKPTKPAKEAPTKFVWNLLEKADFLNGSFTYQMYVDGGYLIKTVDKNSLHGLGGITSQALVFVPTGEEK